MHTYRSFSALAFLLGMLASASTRAFADSAPPAAQPSAGPGSLEFASGPGGVALLELYTSEGCSSCPPAERWFGQLVRDPALWRDFVPVALHVDYWDRLGWRDALADPVHTDRQQAYAAAWGHDTVYTPEFVRAGLEWRPGEPTPATPADAGNLRLRIAEDGRVFVTYEPASSTHGSDLKNEGETSPAFEVFIARLGIGVVRRIRAGENSGRSLRHDFAVLASHRIVLRRASAEAAPWTAELPALPAPPATLAGAAERSALAAWVMRAGSPQPLQALGGWLPDAKPASAGAP